MTYLGETKVLTVCEDTPILEAALKVSVAQMRLSP